MEQKIILAKTNKNKLAQAIIMAGGFGKRLQNAFPDIPKPLVDLDNKPLVWYSISLLKKHGITKFIISTHFKAGLVENYCRELARELEVEVEFFQENVPLGSGGSILHLLPKLENNFFVLNSDVFTEMDLTAMYNYHITKGSLATLVTHPNDHPYDSDIVLTDGENRVLDFLFKDRERKFYDARNLVNAGLVLINKSFLSSFKYYDNKQYDLVKDLISPGVDIFHKVFAYNTVEFIKDCGTVDRLFSVENALRTGFVKSRSKETSKKAIFLDRDGTINEHDGHIKSIHQVKVSKENSKAIRKINRSEYLSLIVSNQPVVARGDISVEDLQKINNYIEYEMGINGAYVDDSFFCLHHPHKGYPGEVEELKVNCNCRKPKPGLLRTAADLYHLSLSDCFIVGDRLADIEAGWRIGVPGVLLETGDREKQSATELLPFALAKNLPEACEFILEKLPLFKKTIKHLGLSKNQKLLIGFNAYFDLYNFRSLVLLCGYECSTVGIEQEETNFFEKFKLKHELLLKKEKKDSWLLLTLTSNIEKNFLGEMDTFALDDFIESLEKAQTK